MSAPTPTNPNPHTVSVTVEVNIYDARDVDDAFASVEAALERIDGVELDDGSIVTLEVPTISMEAKA